MEKLLKVDNYTEGEKQDFGLIEVYPYLHYRNDVETNELDMEKIFEISLDPNTCVLMIHVRSREAQEEIGSYLIGHGFENIKEVEGNVFGITECRISRDKNIKKASEPKNRRYFKAGESTEMLMTKSSLGIRVSFGREELERFKEIIKCLRHKKNYRNRWIDDKAEGEEDTRDSYIIK